MTGQASRPGDGDVMSLDRAGRVYRVAMWAYPRRWRAQYADEVLGVLLAAGGVGSVVDRREVFSLVGNGLLVRVEALFGACSRRTREVAAAGAAAMLMVVSMAALVFGEWLPWRAGAPLLSLEDADATAAWQAAGVAGATPGLGVVMCVTALLGGVATVTGRARAGQGWFAATATAALVTPLVTLMVPVNRPLLMHLALVFGLAVIASAAPVRVRPGRRVAVAWGLSVLRLSLPAVGLVGDARAGREHVVLQHVGGDPSGQRRGQLGHHIRERWSSRPFRHYAATPGRMP